MFYVYALTDPRNENRFFYIGKGKGHRATNHLVASANRENNSKQSTIKAIRNEGWEPSVNYLVENLTETEAHLKEIELIAYYGRKDLGKGHLTNLTDGGEGTSGHRHTDATKHKMRMADRSKYKRIAPVSEETKRKVSESLKGKPSWSSGKHWTEEQKSKLKGKRSHVPCPTKGMKRVYREDGSFYFAKPEHE
jgi:hypothetical protein